ncbi:hypothetical protein [Eleftheria terrae]|uniref:hypothetical protein n=1 Tax=Eleftheria terrae TaxID=1597781 RepID=UPI00263BABD2|nr:hypothetical protein [Eleftheria terrae]WKB53005.1 hypothetical protein N7L95_00960 [Eleftheria terrae]
MSDIKLPKGEPVLCGYTAEQVAELCCEYGRQCAEAARREEREAAWLKGYEAGQKDAKRGFDVRTRGKA